MLKEKYKALWLMSLITLFVFPLAAWPLLWYQEISWESVFSLNSTGWTYIFVMISIGLFFGLFIIALTEIPYFDKALSHIKNRLANIELTNFFVVLLSISAGIGEEVFFRGALQPLLGIYATSIIFVAIHGYFSFTKWAINIFGLLLFVFICFIGWMAENYSIWHAVAAHFSYDLVLLFYYKKMQD